MSVPSLPPPYPPMFITVELITGVTVLMRRPVFSPWNFSLNLFFRHLVFRLQCLLVGYAVDYLHRCRCSDYLPSVTHRTITQVYEELWWRLRGSVWRISTASGFNNYWKFQIVPERSEQWTHCWITKAAMTTSDFLQTLGCNCVKYNVFTVFLVR